VGLNAMYAALEMVLKHETLKLRTWSALSYWDRLALLFRQKVADKRLDWVIKLLLHKGGDVNNRVMGRGDDGLAMVHRAAAEEAVDMIAWLITNHADTHMSVILTKHNTCTHMVSLFI
jgi:hypothetical protein